jgi:uncharacterized membrane protein YphA (DoxX/SURF4 family)
MKKGTIVDIISGLFIILFVYTSLMKIIDHERFDWALHKSPLLYPVASFLAWTVPIGELLIVISLILPGTKKIGLYSSLILMSIFTIYIGFMVYLRSERPCTCGGVISYMNWHQHFYFNIFFTLLALLALLLNKKQKATKNKFESKVYANKI